MKKKLVVAIAAGLAATATFASVASAAGPAKVKYAEHYKTVGYTGDWSNKPMLTWSNGAVTAGEGSTFSYFGGTTNATSGNREGWPTHGYLAQLDVYLDPSSMQVDDGFDLDVASSLSGGAYGRDYIFHVGKTPTGEVLVSGSNNSTNSHVDQSALVGGVEIVTAGWYTFQHEFYDAGDGTLAADLNVIDAVGAKTLVKTLNTKSDLIANAGGPRYMWINFIDGTITFDNQRLFIKS